MDKLYVIDFDGTITKQDTLAYTAEVFFPDKYQMWWEKLKSGEYTINDWLRAFEEAFNVDEQEYKKVLDEIEIDNTFKEFIKDKDVIVLSGGFIYNIKEILNANGIHNLEVYGNELRFIDKNKIKVSMIYFNEECKECGVCKTNIIKDKMKNYSKVIYIGDGITDICASKHSDKVYAKKNSYLERKLNEMDYDFVSFDSFGEIDREEKVN